MARSIVLTQRDIVRFWRKVRRTSDSSCWEWTAGKFPGGYGNFPLASSNGGVGAHRVAWVIDHGPIPDGMCVLHICDNTGCVRHLRLGTSQDNNRDRSQKGRNGSRGVRRSPKRIGKGRPQPRPAEERFWAKVRKTETCWEWTGALASGYGRFALSHGNVVPAHRYSYWLHYGVEAPTDRDLCHRCDNRRCVRVDHLFIATRKENLADAIAKGRFRNPPPLFGAAHPSSKLGPLDVIYIRYALASGQNSTAELAAMFSVTVGTVCTAAKGRTWRSIDVPIATETTRWPRRPSPKRGPRSPPSPEAVAERFWANVTKTETCWLWTAGKQDGHGIFRHPERRRNVRADRFAYELLKGPVEPGTIPRHTCGRQDCCNPSHIVLGSRSDLLRHACADRPTSPKQVRGERCHTAKLTQEDVMTIRRLYDSGQASLAQLTKQYNIAKTNMFLVIHRKTWKHLP